MCIKKLEYWWQNKKIFWKSVSVSQSLWPEISLLPWLTVFWSVCNLINTVNVSGIEKLKWQSFFLGVKHRSFCCYKRNLGEKHKKNLSLAWVKRPAVLKVLVCHLEACVLNYIVEVYGLVTGSSKQYFVQCHASSCRCQW